MLMPAITLCPANNMSMTGWKDGRVALNDGIDNFLEKECNSSGVNDIFECIRTRTYTEEESILRTFQFDGRHDHEVAIWTKAMTVSANGICYTLTYDKPIIRRGGSVRVFLNDTLKYYFTIHDRDFFIANNNPLALSKEFYIIDGEC